MRREDLSRDRPHTSSPLSFPPCKHLLSVLVSMICEEVCVTSAEPFSLIEIRGQQTDVLISDAIACQDGTSSLSFIYWAIGRGHFAMQKGKQIHCRKRWPGSVPHWPCRSQVQLYRHAGLASDAWQSAIEDPRNAKAIQSEVEAKWPDMMNKFR